jgi:hypothetical protein
MRRVSTSSSSSFARLHGFEIFFAVFLALLIAYFIVYAPHF